MKIQTWMCCSDSGGTKGIAQVVKEMERTGCFEIRIFVSGVAPKFLEEAGVTLPYEICADPTDLLSNPERPELVVTSLDSPGSIGAKIVRGLRAEGFTGKIVALSDYPVSSADGGDWADLRPDFVTSGSRANTEILLKSWPDFPGRNILLTGFPALDRFVGLDVKAIRAKTREKLGLTEDQFVIVFLANVGGAAAALASFARVFVACFYKQAKVAIRAHPSMQSIDPDEFAEFQKVAATLAGRTIETMGVISTEETIMMSDVVIASYSTALGECSAMGIPSINFAVPVMAEEYLRTTNSIAPVFPWVAEGIIPEASSNDDLWALLVEAESGQLKKRFEDGRKHGLVLDGQIARRVVFGLVEQFVQEVASEDWANQAGLEEVGRTNHYQFEHYDNGFGYSQQEKDFDRELVKFALFKEAIKVGAKYIVFIRPVGATALAEVLGADSIDLNAIFYKDKE